MRRCCLGGGVERVVVALGGFFAVWLWSGDWVCVVLVQRACVERDLGAMCGEAGVQRSLGSYECTACSMEELILGD